MLLFLLHFMLLDESCTGWKDCRKCQEQTSHGRSVFLGYDSRDCRNHSPKDESNGILVPFRSLESRTIEFDPHVYSSHNNHIPNATPNQTGMEPSVTHSAFGL